MKIVEATELNLFLKEAILSLWNKEYPVQLSLKGLSEFEDYLENLQEQKHFLLLDEGDNPEGWLFVFKRERELWFAMILEKSAQGKGFGSKLLDIAKAKISSLNGWVIDHNNDTKANGETYYSPLSFYLKNNFKVLPDQRLVTAKISAVKICWNRN